MPSPRASLRTLLIVLLVCLGAAPLYAAPGTAGASGRTNSPKVPPPSAPQVIISPEVEPNGTFETATPLVFHGPAAVAGGWISPAGDLDYYSFVAPPNSRVWISTDTGGFQFPGSNSRDTDMLLFDPDRIKIEGDTDDGTGNGGDGSVESDQCAAIAGAFLSAGGTYYVVVYGFPSAAVIKPYGLYVLITYGATGIEAEPNDTAATANHLGLGSGSFGVANGAIDHAGDLDYYEVSPAALDRLFFTVDADPERDGGTDVAVDLLDSDGSTVLLHVNSSTSGVEAAEAADYALGAAGPYYLRVSHAGSGTGTYSIAVAELPLYGACLTTKAAALGADSAGYPAYHGAFADRMVRSGVASRCGIAGVCPGTEIDAGPHTFDAYTFFNDSDEEQCVSVRAQTSCTGLFVAAYRGAFEPDALCDHYLGDIGAGPVPNRQFSFPVGPHEKYVVVVSEIVSGAGCADYTLQVAGTCPSGLVVDEDADLGTSSNQDGVLETGETVLVEPAWRGVTGGALTGGATSFVGPPGPTYSIPDASADYGTPADGEVANCLATGDCYQVTLSGARPAAHWDASLTELSSVAPPFAWTVHVGGSFADVPSTDLFYRFIENVFHNGVTGGGACGGYCPNDAALRKQMAVFVLKAKEGQAYVPPPATGVFNDVPASNPFAPWIEELFHRGVVAGCSAPGGPNYCPDQPVLRQQMAVFLLKTLLGSGYTPPPATGLYLDVPASSPFAPFIEDLARRGIAAGCGNSNFCPTNPNLRKQMAPFLVKTFGLVLYGH